MFKTLIVFALFAVASSASIDIRKLQASNSTNWYVNFLTAQATFSNSNAPEVQLEYNAPAPNGTSKYYKVYIMTPNCSRFVLPAEDASITAPYTNGLIPDTDYNTTGHELPVNLDINTTTIANSSLFYTPGPSVELFTIGVCVQVDLYNELNILTATENTEVTFNVNTSTSFQISNLQAHAKANTIANQNATVDFPLSIYYCDATGAAITPNTLYPGEVLEFCVEANSTKAVVNNLRAVQFLNSLDSTLIIPLIDAASAPTNQQTTITCSAGICRVKTVSFAALYAKRNPDGTVTDISSGAKVSGTALLKFVAARRRLGERAFSADDGRALAAGDTAQTPFTLGVDLKQPPTDNSSANSKALAVAGGAITGLIGLALL